MVTLLLFLGGWQGEQSPDSWVTWSRGLTGASVAASVSLPQSWEVGVAVLRFPGEEPGFGKTDHWLLPVREQENGHRVRVGALQPCQVSRTVHWVRDLLSKSFYRRCFQRTDPFLLFPEEPET